MLGRLHGLQNGQQEVSPGITLYSMHMSFYWSPINFISPATIVAGLGHGFSG